MLLADAGWSENWPTDQSFADLIGLGILVLGLPVLLVLTAIAIFALRRKRRWQMLCVLLLCVLISPLLTPAFPEMNAPLVYPLLLLMVLGVFALLTDRASSHDGQQ